MIAKVIVDIKHKSINRTFDYFVKEEHEKVIKKGMRVIVPFTDNNIARQGLVYDLVESSEVATKYIEDIIDFEPVVDDEIFSYLSYLTQNPSVLLAKAVETIIPLDLVLNYEKKVTLLTTDIKDDLKTKFNKKNEWILKPSDEKYYARLRTLKEKEVVKIETVLKNKVRKKTIEYIEIDNPVYAQTPLQKKVIQIVLGYEAITRRYLNQLTNSAIVTTLIKKGALKIVEKLDSIVFDENGIKPKEIELITKNEKIFEKISKDLNKNINYLFEGSNETSDNLIHKLIEKTVNLNKQVLILVPERFLVNKYEDIYQKLFPNELITTLDSTNTVKQNYLNRKSILDNESKITIGTRSSVFDKFSNLGLVLVLQSHDHAYTQTEGIHYDALEILKIKTKINKCPLILHTHTKTIKQAYDIEMKKLKLISFEEEDNRAIVDIIDMKDELKRGNTKMLSHTLKLYIDSAMKNNKKTLLIMNQKGYSPFVMCRSCGYVPKDKETDIPLNYSEKENILRSNLTKYTENFSKTCPVCHKETMKPVGSGIEQLEAYLEKVYPNERILRIDKDTLSNKEVYEIAEELDNTNQYKLIIGTQMALKDILAKRVSLVGILMADQFLRVPKYDAKEDAYILFNNALHIAENRLVIQSYEPDNVVLNALKGGIDFYKHELSNRQLSQMPPYTNLLQIKVESNSYLKTYQYAFMLKNEFLAKNLKVLGPTPSILLKSDTNYRFLLLVKYQVLDDEIKKLLKSDTNYQIESSFDLIWY